jgi:DNA-binding response OmpR family regulator
VLAVTSPVDSRASVRLLEAGVVVHLKAHTPNQLIGAYPRRFVYTGVKTTATLNARSTVQTHTQDSTERDLLRFGAVGVDLRRQFVYRDGQYIELSPKEYAPSDTLVRRPGFIQTHADPYRAVCGPQIGDEQQYIRVYIRALREKLEEDPSDPVFIQTVTGLGYRFLPERHHEQNGLEQLGAAFG